MKKSFLILSISVLLSVSSFSQIITYKARLDDIGNMLVKQRQLAKGRNAELFSVFNQPLTINEKQCLEFLYAYMPMSDLADYNGEFYLDQVKATLKARSESSWGERIPEDVFLHFVLPVRVNNENLDNFRSLMYDTIKQRIKGLNMHDAALAINHWCHEKVTYRGTDERTSSPLATIKTSFGRCGEESTFTVAAMRCAGIPARQVYTPRWAHTDDNHAWVEVWIDGKWYYLGACEPEPELNMGWFSAPAKRAMLVHTRAYGKYFGDEEVIDSQEKFSELNLIKNYAPVKTFYVKVIDENAIPVNNAMVEFQLYNYAEFYPIAKQKTDKKGICGITSGLGDLLIWAAKAEMFAFKKITVETTDTLILTLNGNQPEALQSFDLIPPVERNAELIQVSAKQREDNNTSIYTEDSIRNAYMSTFADSVFAVNFAFKNGINREKTLAIFKETYGNYQEIISFLEMQKPENKAIALEFILTLTEKDLRDSKAEILNSHFSFSLASLPNYISDTSFYANYVLSPRINIEFIRPWRKELFEYFDKFRDGSQIGTVKNIRDWINDSIILDNVANMHSRSPISPAGVLHLRVADTRSRNIFVVAICRSLTIPARIDPVTGIPQFYNAVADHWTDIPFDANVEKEEPVRGFLQLTNSQPDDPTYNIQFAIASYKDGFYRTLEYDFGKPLSEFNLLDLNPGEYYLITGNRLTDGSVLSEMRFFSIKASDTTTVNVQLKEKYEALPVFGHLAGKDLKLNNLTSGKKISLNKLSNNSGYLLLWLEPGKEPTRHVLVELPRIKDNLEEQGLQIIYLLPSDNIPANFNPQENMPSNALLLSDTEFKLLKSCGLELDSQSSMPVVMLVNKDFQINWISKGYTIGIAEQVAKTMKKMK